MTAALVVGDLLRPGGGLAVLRPPVLRAWSVGVRLRCRPGFALRPGAAPRGHSAVGSVVTAALVVGGLLRPGGGLAVLRFPVLCAWPSRAGSLGDPTVFGLGLAAPTGAVLPRGAFRSWGPS